MPDLLSTLPVTILNGFLGAGKTTLLQNLLFEARKREGLRLGVIVNEMSELDIDGRILDSVEVLSDRDPLFVSIPAVSISATEGLELFRKGVTKLREAGATHLLIETSGSTHPWPLLEAIRNLTSTQLHGFLSIVDTVTLMQDYDLGRGIVPAASRNLAEDRRGIENLLAEQIMFANRILLSKVDRIPEEQMRVVAEAIHPINPYAEILAMQWGNFSLDSVLAMPSYDHERVAQLGAELMEWDESHGVNSMSGPGDYRIDSIVISDPRPFHPQRLWDTYNHYLGTGIYRSKGFFWLPTRDRYQLLWNQTAGSVGLGIVNYWKVAALEDESLNLLAEEREALARKLQQYPGEFGDRHCHLTVIGERDGLETFAQALRGCFCTEQEIAQWREGKVFPDPWPEEARAVL